MRKGFACILLLSPSLFSQSTKINPDCDIPFTFTAAAQRSPLTGCAQNLQGVVTWEMTYQSNGFSALSILVQEAPDASGAAGSWSTFSATVGSNPNTSITGVGAQSGYTGYAPWVSVTLSSATGSGTIVGHLYGWREGAGGGSGGGGTGCPGTSASPCAVDGPIATGNPPGNLPVFIGATDGSLLWAVRSDGNGFLSIGGIQPVGNAAGSYNPLQIGSVDTAGNIRRVLSDVNGRLEAGAPPSSATISLSSSGLTQIIAASSGKTTTIFNLSVLLASGATFQLEYGTGTNCGTGTTAITGTYPSNFTGATWDPGDIAIVPASQAVCVNLGSSVTGGGYVSYSQN